MAVRRQDHDRAEPGWDEFWDKGVPPTPADWTQASSGRSDQPPDRPEARIAAPAARGPGAGPTAPLRPGSVAGRGARRHPGAAGLGATPRIGSRRAAAGVGVPTRPWTERPTGRVFRPSRSPGPGSAGAPWAGVGAAGPAGWYLGDTLDGEPEDAEWYLGKTLDGAPTEAGEEPRSGRSAVRRFAGVVSQAVALAAAALVAWWVLVPLRGGASGPVADSIPGRIDTTVARTLLADRVLSVTAWAGYVSTTLVLGGLVYCRFVSRVAVRPPRRRRRERRRERHPEQPHPEQPQPQPQPPQSERSDAETLLRAAIVLGMVAVACALPLRAAVVSGRGPAVLGDVEPLVFVLRSPFGHAALLRAAGLGLVAASRADGPLRPVAAVTGWSVLLASYLLVGHPQANAPIRLAIAAQVVHVAAVSVWFAGVAFLAVELRQRRRQGAPWVSGRIVSRFSRMAEVMVVLVLASGAVLAGGQVQLHEQFWTTPYGKALVAKLAFVAVVLAIGGYNRQMVVPRVAEHDEVAAWRHLRATCVVESTVIALGVLLMTAAMTSGGFP